MPAASVSVDLERCGTNLLEIVTDVQQTEAETSSAAAEGSKTAAERGKGRAAADKANDETLEELFITMAGVMRRIAAVYRARGE